MPLCNEPHPTAPTKGLNIPKLGVILGRTSNKDIQHNVHEPQLKRSCSRALEGSVFPAPVVAPAILLLKYTNM
jgi:hypothetical protein